MRRIALTVTALFAATASSGCVNPRPFSSMVQAVEPPTGKAGEKQTGAEGMGYSYFGGRAVQTFGQMPATVQPALVSALDDLRIQNVRQITDGGAVIFEGTTADNRKASVTLRPHASGTRLSARIGLFGDELLSRAVMDRVGVRLGTLPPTAIPAEPPSQPASNPYFSKSAIPDSEMLKDHAEAYYRDSPSPR